MADRFPPEVIDGAARQREVTLTTIGRKSGKERRVTIWISTDGLRLFVRSGGGMRRDWPQNLVARGEATLRIGGRSIKVKPPYHRPRRGTRRLRVRAEEVRIYGQGLETE